MVAPFLEGSVRAAGEKLRTAAVVKSLQKAEHQRAREELAKARQRRVSPIAKPPCNN